MRPAPGPPPPGELRFPLPEPLRGGILEAVAHHPDLLPPGMPVLPPGGEQTGDRAGLSQYSDCLSRQRPLARGGVDLPHLGRAPRPGPDRGAGLGEGPGETAEAPALGRDLRLCQRRMGLLPGPRRLSGAGAFENRRHRRLPPPGGVADGGRVRQGGQGLRHGVPRPPGLDGPGPDLWALCRRPAGGAVAPERRGADGPF